MDLVITLLSLNVPTILILLGGVLVFSLFFEEVFGNKLRAGAQHKAALTGSFLIVAGIGLIIAGTLAQPSDSEKESPKPDASPVFYVDEQSNVFFSFDSLNSRGRLFVKRDENLGRDYTFEYTLPDQEEGYAGFVFQFHPPLNITKFGYLEVTLGLDDPEANCDVYLKQGETANYIRICDKSFINGNEIESYMETYKLTVKIPLRKNFKDVDHSRIEEVGFGMNTSFTRGTHRFTLYDVKLLQ